MYVKNKNEKDNLVKHLTVNQNIEALAKVRFCLHESLI